MADIFLSHASEDADPARRLAGILEARGWSVWLDNDQLRAGAKLAEEIERQLHAAHCVVVLWSRAAVAKHWVLDEAEEGKRRGVLIPAALDGVQPPLSFRGLYTADLSAWHGDEAQRCLRPLLAACESLAGRRTRASSPANVVDIAQTPVSLEGASALPVGWVMWAWATVAQLAVLAVLPIWLFGNGPAPAPAPPLAPLAAPGALEVSSATLDYGSVIYAAAGVWFRSIELRNAGTEPVDFTLYAGGKAFGIFRLHETNCEGSAFGWRLRTRCTLSFAFAPPEPGSYRDRMALEIHGQTRQQALEFRGAALLAPKATTLGQTGQPAVPDPTAITVAAAQCHRLGPGRFRVDASGAVQADVDAVITAGLVGVVTERVTMECGDWDRLIGTLTHPQEACKRRNGHPGATNWQAIMFSQTDTAPTQLIVHILVRGSSKAFDRKSLNCE